MTTVETSIKPSVRVIARRVLPQPVRRRINRVRAARALAATRAQAAARGESGTGRGLMITRASTYVPNDHARQVHSRWYIEQVMTSSERPDTVVDLGCGVASSAKVFRQWSPDVRWIGVDIEQSDNAKAVQGEEIILYDGVNLPFEDATVPLIYTNQVFEHVRHPDLLLNEIRRVLVPGGLFIGSTSQLEPYHSMSLWGGYTVFGWNKLCADAGLRLEEARPSIDAIALITRQYRGGISEGQPWISSPLNEEIDTWATKTGASVRDTNARKLHFAGHFCFKVRKPALQHVPPPRGPVRLRLSKMRHRAAGNVVRFGEWLGG